MTISLPPAEVARYAPSYEKRHVRSGSLWVENSSYHQLRRSTRREKAKAEDEGESVDALVHARRCCAGPVGRLPQRDERIVAADGEVPAASEREGAVSACARR